MSTVRIGGVPFDLKDPAQNQITFIGSRTKEVPKEDQDELHAGAVLVGQACAEKGITGISGGCDGLDRWFEEGLGRNLISIRTERSDRAPSFVVVLEPKMLDKAIRAAKGLHPAPEKVKPEYWPLLGRDVAHVLGPKLDQPTRCTIFWAKTTSLSVQGGTRMGYDVSNIVHHGKDRSFNLYTAAGRAGAAAELRSLGIPVERGSWYPRPRMALADHARTLLETEKHARIGIVVPIGLGSSTTKAEAANIGNLYAPTLALAKRDPDQAPSIIGDAWENRVVLIGVPYVQRDENGREAMIARLGQIAAENGLSRLVMPYQDLEPNLDLYKAVERMANRKGPDEILDTPFTFVRMPEAHRGMDRGTVQTLDRGQAREGGRPAPEPAIAR